MPRPGHPDDDDDDDAFFSAFFLRSLSVVIAVFWGACIVDRETWMEGRGAREDKRERKGERECVCVSTGRSPFGS